jgi:hypothetical protein
MQGVEVPYAREPAPGQPNAFRSHGAGMRISLSDPCSTARDSGPFSRHARRVSVLQVVPPVAGGSSPQA